jgi:hypothetical protein
MKKAACIVTILLVLLLSFSEVPAIMVGLSTEQLTKRSDLVIIGRIENVVSMWSDDAKHIISRATVIVREVVRGELDEDIIVVEYLGGEVGGIGLRVSDVRPLKSGEELLFFLKLKLDPAKTRELSSSEAGGKIYYIVGGAQGQYVIDPAGIARKDGFSIIGGQEVIENNIPVRTLIDKIQGVEK